MKEPSAKKIQKKLTACGDIRIDNYYRLNSSGDPKVIAYLKEENDYTEAVMADVKELRENIFSEIISRIRPNDQSVPYKLRGYYYYHRFIEGKDYPVYCRKKGSLTANEEIILDVNISAGGYKYCRVLGLNVSPDNDMLSYGIDTAGRDLYTLHVKNLITGEILKDSIQNTNGCGVWANDGKTLFYTLKNKDTLRDERIKMHQLGNPADDDREIFHEKDEAFNTSVFKSRSGKYIMIASCSNASDEYRFLDADNTFAELKIIEPRQPDLEYSADHFGDKFYIRTNYNAPNFRIVETPFDKTGKENWMDVIPCGPEIFLDRFEIFKDYLVLSERINTLNMIRIIKWSDKSEHYITFDEEVYKAGIDNNPEFDSDMLRFYYGSLTTPDSVYDYDMKCKIRKLLKMQDVGGDFDPCNYESKRLYASAPDGAEVPVSIVYKKGIMNDGTNPLLLYGYGAYGCTIEPYFSIPRLSLLDRGFIFAIAHVRGGGEKGCKWHENGRLLKKKNTFTDFISCAETLIRLKYTGADRLFAAGSSAGGLIMGAIANMRPDLFKGIIAEMPFVDILTTMLDKSIPLTAGEYGEWGDPNVKEYYDYIKSYSPYDNVKAKDYPDMLVTAGLYDAQVQYWEPAKWVARLRELKTDNNMLLLHTDMESGHGGASGRFECYKETALQFAFILKLMKISK